MIPVQTRSDRVRLFPMALIDAYPLHFQNGNSNSPSARPLRLGVLCVSDNGREEAEMLDRKPSAEQDWQRSSCTSDR